MEHEARSTKHGDLGLDDEEWIPFPLPPTAIGCESPASARALPLPLLPVFLSPSYVVRRPVLCTPDSFRPMSMPVGSKSCMSVVVRTTAHVDDAAQPLEHENDQVAPSSNHVTKPSVHSFASLSCCWKRQASFGPKRAT